MVASRAAILSRLAAVVGGVCMFATCVAGFLGWPRPFDPTLGWFLLVFGAIGVTWVWRGLLPSQQRAARLVSVLLFVLLLVIWLTDAPYPF